MSEAAVCCVRPGEHPSSKRRTVQVFPCFTNKTTEPAEWSVRACARARWARGADASVIRRRIGIDALEPSIQRAPADAERTGGLSLVAAGVAERLQDLVAPGGVEQMP